LIAHRKCPFCSGRDLEIRTDYYVAFVACAGCGARGPVTRYGSGAGQIVELVEAGDDANAAAAWAAWNDRRCASLIAEEKGEKDAKQ
jgi:hypothetical protein